MMGCLSLIRLAEADDPQAGFGFGKAQYVQGIIQISQHQKTRLRVRFARVLPNLGRREIELGGALETQSALTDVTGAFGGVVADLYEQIVLTATTRVKQIVDTKYTLWRWRAGILAEA